MTNKNYIKGRNAEYYFKKKLESQGYAVIRTAGSHSPADLIAGNGDLVYAIQVKASKKKLSKNEQDELIEFAKKIRAVPVLLNKGKKWDWKVVDDAWASSHQDQPDGPTG
jgi:Holliday junction resolvase